MIAPFTKIDRDNKGRITRVEPLFAVPIAALPVWQYNLWRVNRFNKRGPA